MKHTEHYCRFVSHPGNTYLRHGVEVLTLVVEGVGELVSHHHADAPEIKSSRKKFNHK